MVPSTRVGWGILQYVYSVMQSDGNSFGGDVVSNSFNKTFRAEDNNLDQIKQKQICSDYFRDEFNSLQYYTKMH